MELVDQISLESPLDSKFSHINNALINQEESYPPESYSEIVLSGYNPNGTIVASNQPEIVTTIQHLNLESEVIHKAVEIFYRIHADSNKTGIRTKSVKGSRKLRLVFYCVFQAYIELDSTVDPNYAADLVGLPQKEVDTSLSEYSPSGVTCISPYKMVPFYVKQLNLHLKSYGINYREQALIKGVNEVIKVCESTRLGKEGIQNTPSRLVAIASLYFYLHDISDSRISEHIPEFESACCVSWACVRRYHESIATYYNNHSSKEYKHPNMEWLL